MALNTLRVTPDQLRSKAAEVSGSLDNIEKDLNSLKEAMDRTSGYWKGEAGTKYRSSFEEKMGNASSALGQLKGYPERILRITETYIEGESGIKDNINGVSGTIGLQKS